MIKLYIEQQKKLQIPALRGIELVVNEGELVAIIGPSGSGKTTLLNIIGGIDRPSTGDIIVGDDVITKMTDRELTLYRRHKVGFLYQLPERNLIWNLTAVKNTMLPMKLAGRWSHEQQKQRARQLLTDVGLERRLNHRPFQLSGGEAQRMGIAIALANDPTIVLADEPTGELDSVTTFKIIDYFKLLNKQYGKTFIVVTHDNRFAKMTDKALRILDGKIVGLHRAVDPIEPDSEREEVIFVDEQGTLRIPEAVLRQGGIQNHVKIKIKNGVATIVPVRGE
ncbi:MAG: ABC transporter ATP-binding protein [Candidatus Hodarchaeota archaeon]